MNEKWILYDKHHPPWHTSAVKHKLLCDVTTSDNINSCDIIFLLVNQLVWARRCFKKL